MSQFYSCAITSQRPTRFKFKYQEYMTSCKRLKKRLHEYQELEIVLVYPFPGHDERWDPKSRERLRHLKENCDQFVMGSKIVGAQGYRERTAYMVEHADCLVAVCDDEPAGPSGVEAVLRMAEARKLPVVLIHPDTGKVSGLTLV